ncbi:MULTISPECIES: glycoside hydrolase family 2 protein [unclassified Roseateles]|uniref:glycoside hydrolase family 2 protein n=1 Tax=unclassified Roseateles TaxID=2626991 RepID=UPI0006F3A93F|nr:MULTISPECIES: glycoside hydrolase family 2 [unclassified Roseateles]KQW42484.1 hypothetical protein ASC81_20510 [Pelomonas sp. Root405]KRA68365.1 hypothetical protein ASD88_22090 [Pelomonas sp. Root662]
MRNVLLGLASLVAATSSLAASQLPAGAVPRTATLMLTGSGPDDAVAWDFTISGGRRAGEKARILVPSNWQQQGFGSYQYGYDKGPRVADSAVYKRRFSVPADWTGRTVRVVFDAVMTDTLVKVNGNVVGPMHQGGFNRFSHDVTRWITPGEDHEIEVQVSEASADMATDIAERHGDYWVFGGIYRPVWLEASPSQSIAHMAINAQASGALTADVTLRAPRTVTRVVGQVTTRQGENVGQPFTVAIPAGGAGRVRLHGKVEQPRLWTAETPNLYQLQLTLYEGDKAVHQASERFGFRTFEVREGQGLYLNGQRVMLKGINRHSFRPETGRAVSRAQAYDDARLIKSMNMNAMRVAHYAPEKAFLEAADELGLYVINELSGWQKAHGTEVGRKLVRALVERDVNHPSILIWANGNEGGWNRELDADFALYDPQARPLIHPWEPFGGIDTKHYPRYPDLLRRLAGDMLVLPTEFLHGLFDGGHGAGLDDYWRAMKASPRGAGGFLWNLADEGIARTDQGGRLDLFGSYAPDGIVGSRHDKEPSFDTVKEIWSPVQIELPTLNSQFDGVLRVSNEYDFTSLSALRFRWEWVRWPAPQDRKLDPHVLSSGELAGPAVLPHGTGALKLPLPAAWRDADALRLVATNNAEHLGTWVWPLPDRPIGLATRKLGAPTAAREGDSIRLAAGAVAARFDARTGLLLEVERDGKTQPLSNGPRLVVARPKPAAEPSWQTPQARGDGTYEFQAPTMANVATIDLGLAETDGWAAFRLELSSDGQRWKTVYDSGRVARDGQTHTFPPQLVKAVRVTRLQGARRTPAVVSLRLAHEAERFNVAPLKVAVTAGVGTTGAWLEAPGAGGIERLRWSLDEHGVLALDYTYQLHGPVLYHGIGFDRPLADISQFRALVRGPGPVWQNRIRGPVLGVYDFSAPAGYYANPQWLRLASPAGDMTFTNEGAGFLQLGARMADFPTTSVDFPASDIGFLHAIPGMGAKMQAADLTGPAGGPSLASGAYSGRLRLQF